MGRSLNYGPALGPHRPFCLQRILVMRSLLALLITAVAPALALAAAPEKMYYVGEVKLSSADGRPMGSQALLLEKIHDPDNSTIIERAIIVHADGKTEERTATMTVKEDN